MMLNLERRQQFLTLMDESGWDTLLLYGDTARKDFFRSLVNFNFFGPHAVAALTSNGMHPPGSEARRYRLSAFRRNGRSRHGGIRTRRRSRGLPQEQRG